MILYSRNPAAVMFKKLDPRAPSPPGCPGDDGGAVASVLPVPDTMTKKFHPNELGHVTVASFAAAELMDVRATVLGVQTPECKETDQFRCWQDRGRRAYPSEVAAMAENRPWSVMEQLRLWPEEAAAQCQRVRRPKLAVAVQVPRRGRLDLGPRPLLLQQQGRPGRGGGSPMVVVVMIREERDEDIPDVPC